MLSSIFKPRFIISSSYNKIYSSYKCRPILQMCSKDKSTSSIGKVYYNTFTAHTGLLSNSGNKNTEQETLSHEEFAHSLVTLRKSGTLTTVSFATTEDADAPLYGSVMPYVITDDGCPIFGFHEGETHKGNITEFNKVSLVVHSLIPKDINPTWFAISRVNLLGSVTPMGEDAQLFGIDKLFKRVHPGSKDYIDKLLWYKLQPEQIIVTEGYERTQYLNFEKYVNAPIDPIMAGSRPILDILNEELLGGVAKLCNTTTTSKTVGEYFVWQIDRFGMNCMSWSNDLSEVEAKRDRKNLRNAWQSLRFQFDASNTLNTPDQVIEYLRQTLNTSAAMDVDNR